MKRSEMLKRLQDFIVVHCYDSYDDVDYANELSDSLHLLEILEKLGMKPPWNDAEYQRQCRKYCDPEGYAWEPE